MLWGTVKVGVETIITWQAQRREPGVQEPDATCTYDCAVSRVESQPMTFVLTHRYGDGAEALLAKLMTEAGTLWRARTKFEGGTTL